MVDRAVLDTFVSDLMADGFVIGALRISLYLCLSVPFEITRIRGSYVGTFGVIVCAFEPDQYTRTLKVMTDPDKHTLLPVTIVFLLRIDFLANIQAIEAKALDSDDRV